MSIFIIMNTAPEENPISDLMKEHGILNRILLIFEAIQKNPQLDIILTLAYIIRIFIEDFHEKMEERYLFETILKRSNDDDLKSIVMKLYEQHRVSRKLTDIILFDPLIDHKLEAIKLFVMMYRRHEAIEDTVVFPAFRKLINVSEYSELKEIFEKNEEEIMGEKLSHDRVLNVINFVEHQLGIESLLKQTIIVKEFVEK